MTREEQRERREAMKAYKAEGHSIGEVAERFGVSEGLASKVCKGIAPQTQRRPKRYNNQYTADTEKAAASRLKRIEKVVEENAPGFEYAGGYTDGGGKALLRCKNCGHIETRTWNTIRTKKANGKAVRCPACYQAEIEARRKEKPQKKVKATPLVLPVRGAKQMELCTCKECGALFIPRTGHGERYCSMACRRRKLNKKHKDKRLNRMVMVDRDIDLRELSRRSGDVCALCGEAVDWNDYEMRGGVFIAGDSYPSVDHIVPLSHKGAHAWNNVQLAHRRCNYLKSDNPPVAI